MPDPDPRTLAESLAERIERTLGEELPELTLSAGDDTRAEEGSSGGAASLLPAGLRFSGRRYRHQGEFARGGMGAILEVFDNDLRRSLAMKVVLTQAPGSSAGPTPLSHPQLSRFLQEAQVTAQLDHPGVVPVHELGLGEGGQVYFTMKLVRGEHLGRIFEKVWSGAEGWTRTRALGVTQRVCEALSFAHAKGVVHRDVKPANVMVGRFGEVYLMDWGLAKVLGTEDLVERGGSEAVLDASDSGFQTLAGQVVGTPAYMPPEQALGRSEDIGPAVDVYAVGAVLYHLLARAMPYAGSGLSDAASMLQAVVDGPPERLGRVDPSLPPELVAICERAMERRAPDRYASVAELGEDLRAFLESRVVKAHRTGALAEARKWVDRNRPLAASLAAGLLFLVAGSVMSWSQKNQADENAALADQRRGQALRMAALAEDRRTEAEVAERLAEERRIAAERSAEEARRQARITEEVNTFLNQDLFAAVAPGQQGIDVSVREVLKLAGQQLEGRFPDEPEVESELRMTIGTSFDRLGDFHAALPQLERALELRERQYGDLHDLSVAAMSALARLRGELGQLEEARTLYERALRSSAHVHGEDSTPWLAISSDLGIVLADQGKFDEARRRYETSLEGERRLNGRRSDNALVTAANLANLLCEVGELEEAREILEEVVEIRRETLGEDHPITSLVENNLARVMQECGRYDEAEQLYLDVRRKYRAALGEEHPDIGTATSNLGVLYTVLERWEEARDELERAVAILEASLGVDHTQTLRSREALAVCLCYLGRRREAVVMQEEILAVMRRVHGDRHPATLTSISNLAVNYKELGRHEEAEALYLEALESRREVFGDDHPMTLITLENLGGLYYTQGRYGRAEELVLEVLDLREQVLGPEHPKVARSYHNVAMVTKGDGRLGESAEYLERALEIARISLGDEDPFTATVRVGLFDVLLEDDRLGEAEPLALEEHRIQAALHGEGSEAEQLARARLRGLYQAWERPEEAARWR